MRLSLILGGTRSGKSRRAEALAAEAERPVIYIATAMVECMDNEMHERVRAHRRRRPESWRTVEGRMDLESVVREESAGLLLIDCLTLWVAYQSGNGSGEAAILERLERAMEAIRSTPGPGAIIVSQETGLGVVPVDAEVRHFRDLCGEVNQRVARYADHVEFLAAGLPMTLKGGGGQ